MNEEDFVYSRIGMALVSAERVESVGTPNLMGGDAIVVEKNQPLKVINCE